jgi:cell division protease FtsH
MLDENSNTVTFADVAGCDEAKEEVKELVDFLRTRASSRSWAAAFPAAC